MLLFGLGAALPLLLLGTLSREVLMRWRDRMMGLGKGLKAALGLILVATGLMIATGYDKVAETALVNASPDWLTALTTRL
jgi:sulfite exporter TauE/SafE